MAVLLILNRQRETLAQVTWTPPGDMTLDVTAREYAAELRAFVENAQHTGLALRAGREVTLEAGPAWVEEKVYVKADDPRFLTALADALPELRVGGQRVFGLLKPE